jgi:hypothetical protein
MGMRKLFFLLFIFCRIFIYAQSEKTLERIFISIPDSFYAPLQRQLPDTLKITKGLRTFMMTDTTPVAENSFQPFSITAFDTLHQYMRLLAKTGDPEGMTAEISYWKKTDGKNLVMMSISYGDMCIEEQRYVYWWIDNGKTLTSISSNGIIPATISDGCIASSFYRKHKKAEKFAMPYELMHDDTTALLVMYPEFDYLFSCGEYFENDPWYGLTENDILKKQVALKWNGITFEIVP